MFHAVPRLERVHPLEGGLFRRKFRRDRRPGMPLEGRWAFYGRYAWDILSKHVRFVGMYLSIAARSSVSYETRRPTWNAMTPVEQTEFETLEMYSATRGAKRVVESSGDVSPRALRPLPPPRQNWADPGARHGGGGISIALRLALLMGLFKLDVELDHLEHGSGPQRAGYPPSGLPNLSAAMA